MEMKRNFMSGAGDNLKGKESLDKKFCENISETDVL